MCGTFLPCSRVAMAVLISSTISKMPGASAAARGGLTVEDGAHRGGEAGQQIQAVVRYPGCDAGDVTSVTDSMMRLADLNGPRRPKYTATTETQGNNLWSRLEDD